MVGFSERGQPCGEERMGVDEEVKVEDKENGGVCAE